MLQILLQILIAVGLLLLIIKGLAAIFVRLLFSLIEDEERSIKVVCQKANVSTESKSYKRLESFFGFLKFLFYRLTFKDLVHILGTKNKSKKGDSLETLISEICGDNSVLKEILMRRVERLSAIVLTKIVLTSPQFYFFLLRRKLITPAESLSPRKTFSEIKQEVFKRYA